MNGFLVRGGRLIDPAQGVDAVCDVRVAGGLVTEIGSLASSTDEVEIDATDLIVAPGLVDLCVHLRDPGFEEVETIRSGAQAAMAGGYTSIAAMPDTDPPVDNEASAAYVALKGERAESARVYPVGALTHGREGSRLSEMAGMKRAGAVAFSDEAGAVERADIFLKALRYAGMLDRPVMTRCEDPWLRGQGVASGGLTADLLGLPAISSGTEEVMLARNLHLARLERAGIHLLHLSTRDSVAQIQRAKHAGVRVTCSVTPAHVLLSEKQLERYDPAFRFMPPLRTEDDCAALVDGLVDGTIDAISSAHSPRGQFEKNLEFVFAAPGTGSLETTFSVLYTWLVETERLSISRLIELLSTNPARILRVPGGRLAVGDPADLTCFDVTTEHRIDPSRFLSHSRVTPYDSWKVRGRARHVLVGGELRYRDYRLTGDDGRQS